MPAHTITTRSFRQTFAMMHQAVDAGYADVVDRVDFVAHHFGGDLRFFRHRKVAGSGADHGDLALAVKRAVAPYAQRTGGREVFGFGVLLLQALGDFRRDARHQDIARFRQEGRRNRGDLIGGLAGTEDHLGHAMTQRAVVIDFCEAQIFERQVTQAIERGVDVHGTGAHFLKQRAQLVLIHRKFQDSSGTEASLASANHPERYPQKRLFHPP